MPIGLYLMTLKYDANWEITNTYENLQIVWSQFFTDTLILIYIWSYSNRISISLLVFGFVANKYKRIAIRLHFDYS